MILRPDYIRAISPFIDTHLVKILSGVRRCGKSTILSMVEQLLLERGSGQENIIRRNYSDIAYDDFTAKDMSEDLKKVFAGSGKCYLRPD